MARGDRREGGGGGALLALAGFAAAAGLAAALGSRNDPKEGDTKAWYRTLDKPSWTPPDWVFPLAWTPLYAAIAVSGYRVWRAPHLEERSRALALWGTQLGLNAAWTPLFFGRQSPEAGLADVALMVPAIGAYMAQARKVDPPAAWMLLPYLAWGTFAAALNAEIVRRRLHATDDASPELAALDMLGGRNRAGTPARVRGCRRSGAEHGAPVARRG